MRKLLSKNFNGLSLRAAHARRAIPKAQVTLKEQRAIMQLIGHLPMEYIRRLTPWELVIEIRWYFRGACGDMHKPPRALKAIRLDCLGSTARCIIDHFNQPDVYRMMTYPRLD